MKRMICLPLVLLLLLPLAGCRGRDPDQSAQGIQLYFLSTLAHGPAIVGEDYTGGDDPTPEQLLSALLAGPQGEDQRSPFPAGCYLRSVSLEDGLLTADFSEAYGGLTDVSLTLADYCVTLTLCQLEGVDSVSITVAGRSMPYRSHQILTPGEASPDGS